MKRMVQVKNFRFLAMVFQMAIVCCASIRAEEFRNLDFEEANLPVLEIGQSEIIHESIAVPGWTSYLTSSHLMGHNAVSLGGAVISIWGQKVWDPFLYVLEGNYSLAMNTDFGGKGDGPAIGQVGTIPADAKSLVFFALSDPGLKILFAGHEIPFTFLSHRERYDSFGADITEFAGQTGELLFWNVRQQGKPYRSDAVIDNIRFLAGFRAGAWLRIVPEGSGLRISWPAWAMEEGYVLESSEGTGGNWAPVEIAPVADGHFVAVSVGSAAGPQRVFRLVKR
jgi:hypothetical protein